MQRRLFERAISLCLAATVTLAILGGIDQLSQPDTAPAQWAQATATRA